MPRAARREAYGPAEHRRMRIDGSGQTRWARLARWGRGSGGRDETWAACSAADVEWRRSPRSSSDPNRGSWRGRRPAGYEVGEGNPCCAELHLSTHGCQHAGEGTMTTSTE